ncbi:hypothetical protein RN001_012427 [Aquatica leii]|uniref:Uncharacterized protein n=1 Tax=Aquatica leii TaxID=1421715 RepID=A0AAN7Q1L2_9COLE|nr:hypothetical protein RN001_012427 [Aquatica leii]
MCAAYSVSRITKRWPYFFLLSRQLFRYHNHKTFVLFEKPFREIGSLKPVRHNAGRPRQARAPIAEDVVLQRFADNPESSCRTLQRQTGISKNTASRIFQNQLLRPFYIQPVQKLFDYGSHFYKLFGSAE